MSPIVPIKTLECNGCGQSFRIRESTLEQTTGHLTWTSIDGKPIHLACPACKHVWQSEIPALTEDRLVEDEAPQRPDGIVSFLVLLQCDRKSCESPIEVLALVKPDVDDHQVRDRARGWLIGTDVICPSGDHCAAPPVVLGVKAKKRGR